jgi:uncharacterized SAM-binding protein YcdF (DUF218 family)
MFANKLAGYDRGMSGMDTPAEVFAAPSLGVMGKPVRPRWLAMLRIATYSLVAVAGLFAAGFGLFASHIGAMSTPKQQISADAIIVLTGGEARLTTALDLLKSGKGKRLLISGVNPATGPNQLRAATGGTRKLFNCCVDFDYEALDTIGNAEESAKWLRSHNFNSVILVTNNYHMPRSLLELGRQVEADLKPYPVVNRPLDNGRWLVEPEALRVLFTEYTKYLAALARGLVPDPTGEAGIETVNAATAKS